ncbi:MAG: hypothetical protein AAGA64_13445 [Bacteroidota bacterium]
MKELHEYRVKELSSEDSLERNGGGFWAAFGAGLAVLAVYESIQNPGDFMAGWNEMHETMSEN